MISLESGKRQVILEGGYFGRYVDGRLIFVRNLALAWVAFDPGSLRVSGSAVSLPLDVDIYPSNGWAGFAAAPNGTLAYRTDAFKNIVLTWSDEDGNEEAAVDSSGRFRDASPSPDGKRIAVVRDGDVWVYDTQRALFSRLTSSEQMERSLTWSPDSREVFYIRDVPQYDIFKRAVDGSRAEELVATSPSDKWVMSISPDGRTLLYQSDIGGNNDIFATSPILQIARGRHQLSAGLAAKRSRVSLRTEHGLRIRPTNRDDRRFFSLPFPPIAARLGNRYRLAAELKRNGGRMDEPFTTAGREE